MVGETTILPGEISVRLAGIDYPLHPRAIKELQLPQFGLFSPTWYLMLSHYENRNIQDDEPLRAWVFPAGRNKIMTRDSVQAHMLT